MKRLIVLLSLASFMLISAPSEFCNQIGGLASLSCAPNQISNTHPNHIARGSNHITHVYPNYVAFYVNHLQAR